MFKRRETILQNIAFMAIIAAINVIASTLSSLFPVASIFIMIFLPFLSASVTLTCKWRYYPIYAIVSIGVALAVTFWNISYTLFYLVPSIITGFLFGLCLYLKLNGVFSLLFTSLIMCALTYISIPIINAIYGVDIIYQFLTIFKLTQKANINCIIPSFIYLLGLVQMLFSYVVISNELKKFHIEENTNLHFSIHIIGLSFALLTIIFSFVNVPSAYLFMFVALFTNLNIFMYYIFNKKKRIVILCSFSYLLAFMLIFILYNYIKMPYHLLIINTTNIFVFILTLLYNLIEIRREAIC